MRKRLFFLVVSFLLLFALLLVGCSKDKEKNTGSNNNNINIPETSANEPVYGGVLHRHLSSDVASPIGVPWEMNPYGHGMALPALEHLMYEDGDGNLHGILATDWTIAPDHSSVTINLRKGVKFHDGTDWNAQAAKWNIDKWIEAKLDTASFFESVDILDDYTIRINLKSWNNTILSYSLAGWNAQMISPTSFEKNGIEWARYHPVGTGPFKFVSYTRDVNIVYEKNPDYWQEGRPYLDGIVYDVIPDLTTASMAFKSGKVHEVSGLPPGAISADLRDSGYNYVTTDHLVNTIDTIFPSSGNPNSPFADKRVREAVEYAIDKEALINAVGFGFLKAAYQLAPAGHKAYQQELQARTYNPEKAKQLLAEAGYPNGFSTRILPNPSVISKDTGVAIQNYLDAVGIKASVDFIDFGQWAEMAFTSGWDGLLLDKTGLFPGMTKGLSFYFSGAPGSQFTAGLKFPDEYYQALNEALSTTYPEVDKVKRVLKILYDEVIAIPYAETPMWAFLYPGVHESPEDLKFDIPPYTFSNNVWMEKDLH